jgi:polyisoprenoid-binding protein YceI
MITKDFKNILKANEYSHIIFEVKEITKQKEIVSAKVKVEIASETKEYTIPITFDSKNNNVKGLLKINIKDFNLKSPKKLLGIIVVNDVVEINFNLFLQY